VNHQILGLHHVREGAGHQTAYDLGFLAFAGALYLAGEHGFGKRRRRCHGGDPTPAMRAQQTPRRFHALRTGQEGGV
jgi:Predicted membrane protein (DUF2243)